MVNIIHLIKCIVKVMGFTGAINLALVIVNVRIVLMKYTKRLYDL